MAHNADPWSLQPPVEPLSARELEILSLMAENHSNREIADQLVLSLNTIKWYARQIYGKLGVKKRTEAVARARELGLLRDDGPAPLPRDNLPAQLTPFIGRHKEVARIYELMSGSTPRLLALVGAGGMGKTRLALQAASLLRETHRERFRDGVYFVPLAAVSNSASLPVALAQAIGLSSSGGKLSAEEQLEQYLQERRMLLVLDNMEQLIDDDSLRLLARILAAAPGVRIMITSRARLNLRGEYLVPLDGMEVPDLDSLAHWERPVEQAQAHSGMQLLLHSVRRVRPDFELRTENLMPMARICALVEGMPLGLELAAAWMTVLEPDEIARRIKESLDFLETGASDVPERQRSLRAVADSSWDLLTGGERLSVQRLSVFRGGFDREGAEEGGQVPLDTLVALVNKCWVQPGIGGRFQIHELLRQYGAEKLARDPDLETAARDQHSRYYCDWLRRLDASQGAELPAAWEAIQSDIDNAEAACLWAAAQDQPGRLVGAITSLGWYYYQGYGNLRRGEITLRSMRAAMAASHDGSSSETATAQRVMVRALCWNALMLQMLLGDFGGAGPLLSEGQALLDGPGLAGEDVSREQAHCSMQTGYATLSTDPKTTRMHMTESLELYQQIDHRWGMAYALTGLGRAVVRLGDLEGAREALTRSLALHEEVENRVGQTEALEELAEVALWQSRFQEAEDLVQQALALTPTSNRIGIAVGLGLLGEVQLRSGRFAEAQSSAGASLPIWEEVGVRVWVARRSPTLARAHMHASAYDVAREQAEMTISLSQELDWERGIGIGKLVLGEVALAEAAFDRAYQLLQESRLNTMQFSPFYGDQSPWLGLAARGLRKRSEAWGYLATALDRVAEYQRSTEQMTALGCLTLLLADEGEAERAVELYALTSRYPYVANSRWFEDVIGRHIADAAARLPAAVAEAARERGRKRDLAATLEEIRQELAGRQNVERQRAQAPEMATGDGHE